MTSRGRAAVLTVAVPCLIGLLGTVALFLPMESADLSAVIRSHLGYTVPLQVVGASGGLFVAHVLLRKAADRHAHAFGVAATVTVITIVAIGGLGFALSGDSGLAGLMWSMLTGYLFVLPVVAGVVDFYSASQKADLVTT